MYKIKLWDEDKWNIHSNSYNSFKHSSLTSEDKKEDKKYHEQKYGTKEKSASSDYMRKDEEREKDDKEKNQTVVSEFDELTRRSLFDEIVNEKKQDVEEDEITFKAAKQIFNEGRYETKKPEKKKEINTIEEAIKKAIEEEKKVIIIDS